jgi:hypothetical protein
MGRKPRLFVTYKKDNLAQNTCRSLLPTLFHILSLARFSRLTTNQNKTTPEWVLFYFAGRPGLEPRLTGPEPVVLPLDDLPIRFHIPLLRGVDRYSGTGCVMKADKQSNVFTHIRNTFRADGHRLTPLQGGIQKYIIFSLLQSFS